MRREKKKKKKKKKKRTWARERHRSAQKVV